MWAVEYTNCISAGGNTLTTSVLHMTLNYLIERLQECQSFGKCGVRLHCHHSQVHSGPEWEHLIGSYIWVKYTRLTFKLRRNKWLMLNWIAWNKTVGSFNSVYTNDWCLIEMSLIYSNAWNHLTLLSYAKMNY